MNARGFLRDENAEGAGSVLLALALSLVLLVVLAFLVIYFLPFGIGRGGD